jgi:hypothetical protein
MNQKEKNGVQNTYCINNDVVVKCPICKKTMEEQDFASVLQHEQNCFQKPKDPYGSECESIPSSLHSLSQDEIGGHDSGSLSPEKSYSAANRKSDYVNECAMVDDWTGRVSDRYQFC